jgi:hypothetical protein
MTFYETRAVILTRNYFMEAQKTSNAYSIEIIINIFNGNMVTYFAYI